MKKVLVVQTRVGIGDMCIFLPCIHEIAKFSKNTEVDVLTKKRTCAKAFLKKDKYIKKIIYLPKESGLKLNFSILNLLKKNKYDECYIFHYGLRYYLMAFLTGVKKIKFYGVFKKKDSIVKKSRLMATKWSCEKKLDFIPKLYLNKKYRKLNQITIGIGGSGSDKKWEIQNYIKLLNMILAKNTIENIVIAGGKNEIADAKKIIISFQNNRAIRIFNLCRKTIEDSIPFLAKSKLYVGNDTGFMHLSGLLDTISVGIFVATSPDYSSYNQNIVPIMPARRRRGVDYSVEKINNISPNIVYRNIKKFLT